MKSSSLRAGHSNLRRQPEETQWVCRAVKSMSLGWSYEIVYLLSLAAHFRTR